MDNTKHSRYQQSYRKGSISVLAGTFSDEYRIKRNTREPPELYIVQEDEWFVPNIEMVYRNYSFFGARRRK